MGVLLTFVCSFAILNKVGKSKTDLYKGFIHKFDKISNPSCITLEFDTMLITYVNHKKIEKDYGRALLDQKFEAFIPDLRTREFSRMGPAEYHAEFVSNFGKFKLFLYSKSYPYEDDFRYYSAVVINKNGEIVQEPFHLNIHSYDDVVSSCIIKGNALTTYSKDIKEQELSTTHYIFSDNGKLLEKDKSFKKL